MANSKSAVPRLDDKALLNLIRELEGIHTPSNIMLQAAGLDSVDLRNPGEKKAILDELEKEPGRYLITRINLTYQHFNIYYIRNQEPGRLSPFYDEIEINHNENQGGLDPQARIALLDHINRRVTLGGISQRDELAAKSIDDLQAIYHSTILKLETSFAQQIEKITDWTVEQTTALEQEKLRLAGEIATERERLMTEQETKLEALRRDAEALEQRRKDLDDRDYMHARRGTLGELRKRIIERQQKFTLTPETTRLRWPIHAALIVLILILLGVNVVTASTILNLDVGKVDWPVLAWAFGKQSVVTIALVGALFFYVRWMNRWFEQHASAEFLLKQFELDINRASWVVETAMEWRRDQHSEIPAPLLEGVTRNLFTYGNSSAQDQSAADDLASALVGNASGLKLKVGDNEINFDRKGLSGLAKT
ncbi:hypothetical protein [Bradyrhizobium sp. BR 10261]|uniref:hypothetical protein n=1 Tax=Bradyrhizobium sp. BR 10261 TaxID=2749992 RepID=UPI001C647ED6|nr:hypothetical protein [Bradyrhizobium sp. BR 10261]MBW7964950.1 hypothetical protein [Bradyrhizobium sp. BR 10261]